MHNQTVGLDGYRPDAQRKIKPRGQVDTVVVDQAGDGWPGGWSEAENQRNTK